MCVRTPNPSVWALSIVPPAVLALVLFTSIRIGGIADLWWMPALVLLAGIARGLLWRSFLKRHYIGVQDGPEGLVLETRDGNDVTRRPLDEVVAVTWLPMAGQRLLSHLSRDGAVTVRYRGGEGNEIPMRFTNRGAQRRAEVRWQKLLEGRGPGPETE